MKRLLLPLALLLVALPGQAQDAASVTWTLTEAEGLTVSSTEGVATGAEATSATLVVRDYTGTLTGDVNGPLGPYQRWWLDNAEWPVESSPDADRYVEFAVSAVSGGTFTVTDIDLVMNAGGTGEMDASIFYDTDPSFSSPTPLETDIDVSRDAVGTFSYDVSETLTGDQTLYVRVYPWLGGGNASATRYLFLQNVMIAGTGTEPEPEPVAGVNWHLTEADTTAVSETGPDVSGNAARGEGVEVRDYTGELTDGTVGPLGPFQRWWLDANWPDEAAPNPDRYIEFAASADEGFAFAADSVSLYLNAGGTGNMMASLYYSTSPAFAEPVALEEGIAVSRDALGYYSYPVDVTVPEGSALYVRVYPYLAGGSTSAGKYVFLQDVTLAGEAREVLDAEGVYWALTATDTTSVTAAGDNLGGSPVRASELMVRNYADDSDPGPGPLGAIQRWWLDANWPDEAAPNPDRYIEFAASADEGFAFAADSIALYMGSHGTSKMMASLYYSTSPTFADSVALEEGIEVPRTSLGYYSYPISVTVPAGDSLYFRIYPYLPDGSTSVGKYLLLQAVTLAGEAVDAVSTGPGAEPSAFALHTAFPNPVRSTATVRFELAEPAEVQIHVVNVLGQRVATLASGPRAVGSHDVTLDASGLAAGAYFVRMLAGGEALSQQVVVVR